MQTLQRLRRSIFLPLLRLRSAASSPGNPAASSLSLLRSFTASAPPPPRWCLPAPDPPAGRLSRFPNGCRNMASTRGTKGNKKLAKPADNGEGDHVRRASVPDGDNKHAAILLCGEGPPGELSDDEEFARLEAAAYRDYDCNYPAEDVDPMHIFPYSTHRDGSIYRGEYSWKKDYRVAERNETWIEAMMLSDPKDCMFDNGTCIMHRPRPMLQIFSVKLAKIPMDADSVELYGYIATRDVLDPLLNYIVNVSRNDPILIKQGSLIEMTGPKRGIELCDTTLIEYDMRMKTGKQEKDDLQLIDGASIVDDRSTDTKCLFTKRIHGDCGAVDITVSRLDVAVEATIEVHVSEVRSTFNLCVGCFTSGLNQEIQLFDGAIGESRGLRRSVVAAVIDTWMDLKFKVGSGPYSNRDAEHCYSFKAINHGWTSQLIKTEFASILVKVTWSTLSMSNM
ncbi:unnamed protein product [Urochloa decumbens]|uniref:DUF6598 domain-containing protein n=1 Tax=Urochloa decumbens TaxID=240449 RepID=A0ABC9CPS6_9POAL